MIRQVTKVGETAGPTAIALARPNLVVAPPVGDQVRDDQTTEAHAETTPQVDQLAASQHPAPIDPGAQSQRAKTVDPVATATRELLAATTKVETIVRHAAIPPATVTVARHVRATAITARLVQRNAQIAAIVRVAPNAVIAQLVRSATTGLVARNVEVAPNEVPAAAMAPPRSACGLKAVRLRAETTTRASASLKKIATPSASVRSVLFTRRRRSLRASLRRCLTGLPQTSSKH